MGAAEVSPAGDRGERNASAADAAEWQEAGAAIIAGAPWGVLAVGADGVVRAANAAAERMLGASRGLLAGCSILDPRWRTVCEDGATCGTAHHPVTAAAASGQTVRRTVGLFNDAENAYRWVDMSAVPDTREPGAARPLPVFVLLLDVSDRITQMATLRAGTEQLRISERMDALGRLTGGIAHDFNNLLSVINGYAELLDEDMGAADPRKADILQIRDAGQRGSELVKQLLMFSRQQPVQPRLLDLHALASSLTGLLRRVIGEHITLDIVPGDGPGMVLADSSQMQQVIVNLATNARDAMRAGGMLTIETAAIDVEDVFPDHEAALPPGAYVRLMVTDTGHGIDEAARSRIFDPFFTTKPPGEGTGLGLATVHRNVTQAGGHISVTSEVGRGTRFRVYLPRAETPPDVMTRVELPPLPGHATETVLVVEDDGSVRELTQRMLEHAGYTVMTAADGPEAEACLATADGRVHLVLTDVVLPHANGRDLVARLMARAPDLRVLYMSGYTDESIAHHGVLDEGVSFIGKPFSVEALCRKVREVLDR